MVSRSLRSEDGWNTNNYSRLRSAEYFDLWVILTYRSPYVVGYLEP